MVGTVMPHKTIVPAPPVTPPRYSLLGVLDGVVDGAAEAQEDERPVRWQQGVEWRPAQKFKGGVIEYDCNGRTPDGLDTFLNEALAYGDPFAVYAESHCSAMGFETGEFEERARDQLLAVQSALVAAELERGALAAASDLDNIWLTKAPAIVGVPSAQAVALALGDIEMGLAHVWGGRNGQVHVSPAILTALVAAQVLTFQGQKWLTPMGNLVVADAGYTGAKPDTGQSGSTNQWMYGTAPIRYRLSEVMLNPGSLPEALHEAMSRSTNDITLYAQRLALLQWDTIVVAAETNIPAFSYPS